YSYFDSPVLSSFPTRRSSDLIDVIYEDDVNAIPATFDQPADSSLIIFTPAVPKDLKIKNHFVAKGFELYKRSQVLGFISASRFRSEEHTSELQSRENLVCRLL